MMETLDVDGLGRQFHKTKFKRAYKESFGKMLSKASKRPRSGAEMSEQGQLFDQKPTANRRDGRGKKSRYDRFKEQIKATVEAFKPTGDREGPSGPTQNQGKRV